MAVRDRLSAALLGATPLLAFTLGATATFGAGSVTPDPGGNPPLEATRSAVSSRVTGLARRVDAFFADPNYSGEEADARLELGQQLTVSEQDTFEPRTRVRLRVSLPGTSRRTNLVFEGNDSLSAAPGNDQGPGDELDRSLDDPAIGLEYFPRRSERRSAALAAGFRFGDPSVYVGPRVRYQYPLSERWLGRLGQRLRWYTADGWESRTRVDFDRTIGPAGLFRERLQLSWIEDERRSKGIRVEAEAGYTHILGSERALRYAWTSEYRTRPTAGPVSTRLSVSYRQWLLRDWIQFQVAPFVVWDKGFDWQANPGVRASVTLVFEGEDDSPRPDLLPTP